MTRSVGRGRLDADAARAEAGLAAHAGHLSGPFRDALGEAADTVGRRLRAALVREDIGDARARNAGLGRRHGFDRVEFGAAGVGDPADLLAGLDAPGLAAELRDAVVNLAVALARGPSRAGPDQVGPDEAAITAEQIAVAGHNLHPCGRTRLGWDTADVLAHDVESGHTRVGFVAVRDDGHLGDDVGLLLRDWYPRLPAPPPGFRLQPVHAWQRDAVLSRRYRDLLDDGALRLLDAELDAVPTGAVRTVLLPPDAAGRRHYLKLSLDILITSTRRSISVASTRNGPVVSRLVRRLIDADPDGHRLLPLAETAGAAVPAGSGRDMSVIVREALPALRPGETVVPGGALPALAGRLAAVTGAGRDGARAWLDAYARLLLPPLLRLTRCGVALEAHLQNCLPTFVDGRPHRMIVRDFAGLRLHAPRLAAAGHRLDLWPGSVIGTADVGTLRAKIGYTALQAHLGEVIIALGRAHGLDEDTAWGTVRAVVDDTYAPLLADPDAAADHAALTAPRAPHKALVRMRLSGGGDLYVPVRNPLHGRA
ncbi:IucA/IucC family siderophore biosynthesis protein [Mangrovihabitans endophyticus]|uniref:Iron transporter n=1 Tax=Mangrovihabitans endophyticus TaxID=1751298 RepID=A0A8J3C3H7_9ACTN|nr:IucA/IucC family siderophore biosynthesis protein [Mangrovihabitans endophyticus]GGL12301.1 iron transporter [Mangrovihabitans endophyticus]